MERGQVPPTPVLAPYYLGIWSIGATLSGKGASPHFSGKLSIFTGSESFLILVKLIVRCPTGSTAAETT